MSDEEFEEAAETVGDIPQLDPTDFIGKQYEGEFSGSEPEKPKAKKKPQKKVVKEEDTTGLKPFFIPKANKTFYGKNAADAGAKADKELKKRGK